MRRRVTAVTADRDQWKKTASDFNRDARVAYAERDEARARLAAVEAVCERAERERRRGSIDVSEVRAALSGAAPAPQPAGEDQ